jgi:DNA-binding SARP family transcriptional activator
MMEFRALGPVGVLRDGVPVDLGGHRERALLALLLLTPDDVVPVETLVDELWEGSSPAHGSSNLRVHVSRLRKALGSDRLETKPPGYRLVLDGASLDVLAFDAGVKRARDLSAKGDPEAASRELRETLALWRGRAFADVIGPPAVNAQAARLDESRLGAIEDRVAADLACGRHVPLAAELEELTTAYPLRERLWEQRVLALYRCGRQAEALSSYQALRVMLLEEHGLEPNPALRRLEHQILNQDPSLDWESPPSAPVGRPLPAALTTSRGSAFVGREPESARVQAMWERATGGQRKALLVAGDPGIGKSRLLAESAQWVYARGGIVLFGRCDEETLVPYQPFVEALRHYASHDGRDRMRELLGRDVDELTLLLPELRGRPGVVGDLEPAEGERYRLFEAVNRFLSAVSSEAPVLLVLEDLQWVDAATALLLRHLFRHPEPGSLLVLASYRDMEIAPGHAFSDALSELRGADVGERIRLGGLSMAEVAGLVNAQTGDRGVTFAESLWRQTEGNPFFVEEVVRQLRDLGALPGTSGTISLQGLGIPEGVKDVIGRRLLHLSETANGLLELAAVIGRDFEVAVIEAVVDVPDEATLEALDHATRAGLVRETPGRVGSYSFTHALIRETIYSKLSLLRRVRMHRMVGEAIERLHDDADHLAELAHHFLQAAGGGEPAKALLYAEAAGLQALGRVAYEEADGYYRRALEVLEGGGDPGRRAELLLGLGEARRRAGDTNGSREACFGAATLARQAGDADTLGRAALAYGLGSGGLHRAVRTDEQHIALLEEALIALGEEASASKVRLLARLAEELYFTPQTERRFELAEQAVTMAKGLADPAVLLPALYARDLCRVGPDVSPEDRIQSTGELADLAFSLGDAEMSYLTHMLRELAFIELGDLVSAQRELDGADRLAQQLRMPSLRAWVTGGRARRAWMAGEFGAAEELNATAMTQALEQGGDPDVAGLVLGGQLLAQQLLRADLTAFVPTLVSYKEDYPNLPILRCFLAYAYAETDKVDLARAELDALAVRGFTDVPRTVEWDESMWALSRCITLLADASLAGALYRELLPSAGRWFADWASICCGPVDTALGMLAGVQGQWAGAEAHFEQALVLAMAAPCLPWLADTQHRYAVMLLSRAARGDRAKAEKLLAASGEICDRISMTATAERVHALLDELGPRS